MLLHSAVELHPGGGYLGGIFGGGICLGELISRNHIEVHHRRRRHPGRRNNIF